MAHFIIEVVLSKILKFTPLCENFSKHLKIDFPQHECSFIATLNQNCYKEALSKVLENEFLTTGPICREVQSSLEDYFSIASCILTSSWPRVHRHYFVILSKNY